MVIRGVPEKGAEIYNNWFYQGPEERFVRSSGRTQVRNNACGLKKPVLLRHAEPKP